MRLQISRTKNAASYYVVKSVYSKGNRTSKVVEKLGTEAELREKLGGRDPYGWAKEYITELNRLEKEGREPVVIAKYAPDRQMEKGQQRSFNGGYLFLQKLYHDLKLHTLCNTLSQKYKFTFSLDAILSRLLYSRILYPASKRATLELSSRFIEQPTFDLQHLYRGLDVLAKESNLIQSALYENSRKVVKRNTKILYYDCTNFYFEIEQESGLRQYGKSKENRPNPIVQMGLFMDADGFPLGFQLLKGNQSEQTSLQPLEEKILSDFDLSQFVVCTDAGLSSLANRRFNTRGDRSFITTQSIKKLKGYLREWALSPTGWHLSGSTKEWDVSQLENEALFRDRIFYKERWMNEGNFEQKLIVTYSLKYRDYQRSIRAGQVARAEKALTSREFQRRGKHPNDPKRFIATIHTTPDGEVAAQDVHHMDYDRVRMEEKYDGFYAVCTNLDDDAERIAEINRRRWEIEYCFRIMKSEFKARPIYLQRDDRIEAHFITCFIALMLYRMLEKKLGEKYSCGEIISGLRQMNFYEMPNNGYVPTYTRTDFTDDLHQTFGFRTDYEIVTTKQMKKIFKATKN